MRQRQRGFSGLLVMAAIAVLASVGVWATGLVGSAADSMAQSTAVARAQEAAAAGLDWARWRARVPAAPLCSAVQNVALPGVLAGWTVTTRCTLASSRVEAGVTVRRWRISADACNQASAGACPAAAPAAGYAQASRSAWVERP